MTDLLAHETIDFVGFHEALRVDRVRLERGGSTAAGLAPFAFAVGEAAFTYAATPAGVEVRAGSEGAATVMRIAAEHWELFAAERLTRYGLLYNASPEFDRGGFEDLCHWEPTLRAIFHGRPVYDPAAGLVDRSGAPLDLRRVFTAADDPADLAHFLRTAGFVHRRGVFDAAEVAALGDEVDRLCGLARADDLRSWWTVDQAGRNVVCQLKYGALGSELITDLHDDPRVRALLDASGERGLLANLDRNEGTKIIIKHPGASEGLTDLPLHTDCGMGYHPISCQMVLVGVHLDAGTAAGGRLHMTAGSHVASTPDPAVVDVAEWPIVELDTRPGDCTVHYSHTLHAAPPPEGEPEPGARGRRTIYSCYAPPSLFDALEPLEDLVAVMQRDDGVTRTVDEQRGGV